MRRGVRLLGRRCLDPALPWEVQRTRLDQLTGTAPLPRGTTIETTSIAGLDAEVVTGSGPATVIHFHGGGYCVGSPRMIRSWAARLSLRADCRVVMPVYRLAPEHPYPAALDDARKIFAELASDGPVVLSGDSAGAGLALALAIWLCDEGQEQQPAGCILLSPWLDLGMDRLADRELVRKDLLLSPGWLEACAAAYGDPADPLVSPLRAEHAGLPPLLIQAGTDEILAPDSDALAVSTRAAGVDVTYTKWPGMWHDFALQPGLLAAADSALAQAVWFTGTVSSSLDGPCHHRTF
jgi:acetyl esterase/lipase